MTGGGATGPLPAETDVLVVGGGPVGSTVAAQLRLHGIDCAIVEREPEITYWVRAQNVDMRTMEHLRRFGCARDLRACSQAPPEWQRDLVFCTGLFGRELAVVRGYGFREEDSWDLATEPAQPIPQEYTNGVIRQRAVELGAQLATGWSVTGLEQDADGVRVDVAGADGEQRRVRAAYVVGCDGGRSVVREAAAIPRSGAGGLGKVMHVTFRSPVPLSEAPVSPASFYLVFTPEQGGILIPISLDEYALHLAGYAPDEDTSEVDFGAAARSFVGLDRDFEVRRVAPYLLHQLITDTYRNERVFIAGDAAHLHAPFGGFNLNTGIGDGVDIGWKLAAVLHGWGGERLLDSYTTERRPITLARSHEATDHVKRFQTAVSEAFAAGVPLEDTPAAEARRRAIGDELHERTRLQWNTAGVVLDQRYVDSPIVVDDGSTPPEWRPDVYQPCAKPGHRAPHIRDEQGTPLYDRLGREFTLLVAPGADDGARALGAAAADRGVPLTVLPIDERTRGVYEAPLVLVRPDQQVAWRASAAPADPLSVIDTVRGA